MSYQPQSTAKILVQPGKEPVTLAEAKKQLNAEGFDDDDDYIKELITSSREFVELWTRRAFITQTWNLFMDDFPINPDNDTILIYPSALISVISIKYIDEDGDEITLAASKFRVDTSTEPARITPAFNEIWPSTRDITNAVTLEYKVGFGDPTDVPRGIKQAIKMAVAGAYEHREEISDIKLEDNPAWLRKLYIYKVPESF